jgi:DNA-binding beta-propeller fold protein YncE
VQYFTPSGSFLGTWGVYGTGNGEFYMPLGIDVTAAGRVLVTDYGNHRIQYFTPAGSFLGMWGTFGTGNGEFNNPFGLAVTDNGSRVYVADSRNSRVQYFRQTAPAVLPASVGKVKALFR